MSWKLCDKCWVRTTDPPTDCIGTLEQGVSGDHARQCHLAAARHQLWETWQKWPGRVGVWNCLAWYNCSMYWHQQCKRVDDQTFFIYLSCWLCWSHGSGSEVRLESGCQLPFAGINRKYMIRRSTRWLFSKVASSLCAGGYFVATVPDPSRRGHQGDQMWPAPLQKKFRLFRISPSPQWWYRHRRIIAAQRAALAQAQHSISRTATWCHLPFSAKGGSCQGQPFGRLGNRLFGIEFSEEVGHCAALGCLCSCFVPRTSCYICY